jgi:hypothetical protein
MKDAIEGLAKARLLETALDLIVQLEKGTGLRPVLFLLVESRKRAAAAMVQLAIVDPTDANSIRTLQNEIVRFDDLVTDCRALVARGRDADRELRDEDRQEAADLVMSEEDARALGIEPQGSDL